MRKKYIVNVFDFGKCKGKNLLIEVRENASDNTPFIRRYYNPIEARVEYNLIRAFDEVDTKMSEDLEFHGNVKYQIAQDDHICEYNFTHLGRAMFPEYVKKIENEKLPLFEL